MNMNNNPSIAIHSTNFTDILREFQLVYNGTYSDGITNKDIIRSLILFYSGINNFEFLAFDRSQRHLMYIILYELYIPYTKDRIDSNYVIITLNINNDVRNYIRTPNQQNLLLRKNFLKPKLSNNMQKKLEISDIIFDIKETLTDNMFKTIMDTLSEIKD